MGSPTKRAAMKSLCLLVPLLVLNFSCIEKSKSTVPTDSKEVETVQKEAPIKKEKLWVPYDETAAIAANKDHEKERMRFKLIQSKVTDKNQIFEPLYNEVSKMTEQVYETLKPLILEQDIPSIQQHIANGGLTYEQLTLFYLYRIYKFELNPELNLNTIISLNQNVLEEARVSDAARSKNDSLHHPIYGMPILLKDNINTSGMPTTAGSVALRYNRVNDAYITSKLKEHGALILGKVNLSEWAYFMCRPCPVGYSAIGGQTLNPYGRGVFESGGSSSGSGTSVAANYAVAAVGTETSGSILSPSSQNAVVGLKPTVGLLSRTGIVPISSTLDTPGPMTKNIIDNGILLDAMMGYDEADEASVWARWEPKWYEVPDDFGDLKGKRLGVFKALMDSDSLYKKTVTQLANAGARIIEFEPPEVSMDGFISILNIDMKNDLPAYLENHVRNPDSITITGINDLIGFNNQDTVLRIPYGHALFEGILRDSTTPDRLAEIKERLQRNGRSFFNTPMNEHRLDAILSINNYHASYAAVATYPALTIPMGYRETGEPVNLTFIGKRYQEGKLLHLGAAFEALSKARRIPKGYE